MNRALLWVNVLLLVGSIIVWVVGGWLGWLDSVTFVSHVSMAALVFSALAGIPAAKAACDVKESNSDSD